MAVDWHTIILDSTWLERLDRACYKRFGQEGLAEEASAYVIDALSQNDWERCSSFTGKAKPETFLYTLCANLIEEFARKRFGRPRPPEWLKNEGDLWVSIWKMVCLERQMPATVIDRLSSIGQRSEDLVKGIILTIKGRLPWCGSSHREIPSSAFCQYAEDDSFNPEIESEHTLEQSLDNEQYEQSLEILAQLLGFLTRPSNKSMISINSELPHSEKLLNLGSVLELSQEERLILKMAYQEGVKLNVIAKALNMPSYQPGRLLKAILKKIEAALLDIGMPLDELSDHLIGGSA